ncbi:MAG: M14 family metallopeptidase [Flavobacterium sp.]|nr:M14 family metallopeptidase [Flavobacterium sp.]
MKKFAGWLGLSLAVCTYTSCTTSRTAASLSVDITKPTTVTLQKKKDFIFQKGSIGFSNKFSAARLNKVTAVNDSTYSVLILPENNPVNPSPWYAFKIWSKKNRQVYLQLQYQQVAHRYNPKFSINGKQWQRIDDVLLNKDSTTASFKVTLTANDTAFIAAQELIDLPSSYLWIDSLASVSGIYKQVIGNSINNNPIVCLNTKAASGKEIIVVLSRQHPPEVTGYRAMQHFVNKILDRSPLSKKFLERFEVIIIPTINPDGVDEGHWRHNMAGVDLNRDWEHFKQPETQAIRNYIVSTLIKQQAKIYFVIDFHSTWNDVFYTNTDDKRSNAPGFINDWLKALEQSIPSYKVNANSSGNRSNVSKAWFDRICDAEALTYEVGDNTSAEFLKTKATIAAEKMMELLLQTRALQ